NKLYDLEEILLLCVCAVISGAEGWESIRAFGLTKLAWLRQFLPYTNGIPSADCLGWVMARLSPTAFQACFMAWTRSVAKLSAGEVVAIDGKTLRRSYDRRHGCRAIHMVSAWADANRLSLGQVATAEKSNELTAIPKLLELLELTGCIVTIDAMGCQKTIAAQIVATGADYVLAVKANQPLLYEAIDDYFEIARAAHFQAVPAHFHEHLDADHGRYEVRRYWLVNELSTLPEPHSWARLRGIGMVETERHEGGRISRQRRYYITTLVADARAFANAVRAHWGVENRLHWVLDVTFREDESRIRQANAPANFNTIRQFALNLLQRAQPAGSVKQKKFNAALDDDFRAKVLFQQ
ncbi:ISAs1 family transposase, partial [Candidatus Thiosymbion oneisti]|uniref:ISAs1 family transposase n=1 Tax=Candidatus Thiosymbion oneisti TaxID=589554 RepID=UPI000AEDDC52